jgi:Uma2 family endonuclease
MIWFFEGAIAMTQTPVKLTFEDYLTYDDGKDNRYELERGELVLMNPPTVRHLLIAKFIERLLDDEINRLERPWVALREAGVQTESDSSRLPDVCVVTQQQVAELMDQSAVFRVPAQLAVEIVSPSSVERDYKRKPLEYANKGIQEYWVVDPIESKVTIFQLVNGRYRESVFTGSQRIVSHVFSELAVTAHQIFSV